MPEIVTGKPVGIGGIARAARGHRPRRRLPRLPRHGALDIDPIGATAIVQGFGNVGSHAALALAARGVKIVGVSDHTRRLLRSEGSRRRGRWSTTSGTRARSRAGRARPRSIPRALLTQPCDVLAPGAVERVITRNIAGRLRCRILAEGANGPTTPEADRVLAERNDGIFVIPDILCNAGGVVVSYFEWVQDLQQFFWSKDEVMDRLERALDRSWMMVVERARRDGVPTAPRRWPSASSGCARPSRRGGCFREERLRRPRKVRRRSSAPATCSPPPPAARPRRSARSA